MEKDDFRSQLSFGEDVFGGPVWRDLVGAEKAAEYVDSGAIPVMLDPDGVPIKEILYMSMTWLLRYYSLLITLRQNSNCLIFV